MGKLRPLTDSKVYVDFTAKRDTLLEHILHIHLTAIDHITDKLKNKILALISNQFFAGQFRVHGAGPIHNELKLASVQVSEIVLRLRSETYLLAHASEAEAIGRALGKETKSNAQVKQHKLKDMPSGGDVYSRLDLSFSRLGRKIQDALQSAKVQGENGKETIERVSNAFPKTRTISKTPALRNRKLKEAAAFDPNYKKRDQNTGEVSDDDEGDIFMSTGIADENMWDDILNDYKSTELPDDIFKRGPQDKTLFYDVETGEDAERYTWEVEQEITEDFVRSVRGGTQDAANQNGITDFMWVAVVDSHTDECCSVRDGMSSSEIESAITSGKIDSDECDAIVAPGHFNCRCNSVPMSDEMADTSDVDYSGWDDWLKSKAA